MNDVEMLTSRFEQRRPRLRSIAYRMLGSVNDADDAVQEAWLRLRGASERDIDNLDAWLTTVVSRVCLHVLRSRRTRAEVSWDSVHVPDPIVTESDDSPEHRAVLDDSIGLALLIVLDSLDPRERLALVLHDAFAVPFVEVASLIDTTPVAARQLASRARRKVRAGTPAPDADPARQRAVVDAFFAAAHAGNFDRLVEIMHPDVVLRSDGGTQRRSATMVVRGAVAVARSTRRYAELAPYCRPVLVNGAAGVVVQPPGGPFSVMGFLVSHGQIVSIDVLADPTRLAGLNLTAGAR